MNLIKEKIKNGEGFIDIEGLGIKTVKEWNDATDPKWNKTLVDYQSQIDISQAILQEEQIRIENEIKQLQENEIEIKKEFNLDELRLLYIELKEAIRLAENKPKVKQVNPQINPILSDEGVMKVESRIKYIRNGIETKLFSNRNEVDKKRQELKDIKQRYEDKMIEISNDLQATRQPLNPNYLENQKIKYKVFSKHDYKIVDDELVLLTDIEKLDIAREKKKKEIANQLISLYPEKVIDGTLNVLKDEKYLEIDSLETIENIRNYKL